MNTVTAILFALGLVALIAGAEVLVRGASRLAAALGISPLVIGLTVVAFGTSTPELAVSIQAGLSGEAEVALGNVIGSNISNVLLILGAVAAVAPLAVASRLIRHDVWVMIGVSVLAPVLGLDGKIGRVDGLLLLAGAVFYTGWLIHVSRRGSAAPAKLGPAADGQAREMRNRDWLINIALVLLGLVLLTIGARWLVSGAVAFARALEVSELIVGLTIVAVGTSLPELATSIVAAMRGQHDIAVGNVIGSNIFNILLVLGASAAVSSAGVSVSRAVLVFDLPIMAIVAIVCLPVFFTGYRVDRWEGLLFLAGYAAYLMYLILDSSRSGALAWYRWGILGFGLPLTSYVLITSVVHSLRSARAPRA